MTDPTGIEFELDGELTAGSIVTLVVRLPGVEVRIMGELLEFDRRVRLARAHMGGARSNSLGLGGLAAIARAFAETFDVDEILVEGGPRTSGARPGHQPLAFRWKRVRR